MFSRRDLGEGGVRFLRRVRESQMFCNYCHTQSMQRKALRVQAVSLSARARQNLDLGFSSDNMGGGDINNTNKGVGGFTESKGLNEIKNSRGMASWNGNKYAFSGPGSGTRQSSQHSEKVTVVSVEDEEDSLVSLFKIMLTGTIPMKQSKIDLLIASYRMDEARLIQNYDGKTPKPLVTSVISATTSASSSFTSGTPQSNRGDRGGSGSNNGGVRDIHIVRREKERTVEDEIVWCNGRCNGSADGPLCSAICMKLWAERVQQARKTISVKRAIARQHHSGELTFIINLHYVSDVYDVLNRAMRKKEETMAQVSMTSSNNPSLSDLHSFFLFTSFECHMQIVDSSSSIDQLFGMGIAYHYVLFRKNCLELLSVDGFIFSYFLSFYFIKESSLCASQFVWVWLVSCISSFLVIFCIVTHLSLLLSFYIPLCRSLSP